MGVVKPLVPSRSHKTDMEDVCETELLRSQLHETQQQLHKTREHVRLHETRSRQLVNACAVKLRHKQQENERALSLKDRQLQRIMQQLTVLQSRLRREQQLIVSGCSERDQLLQVQQRELDRLRRQNRRLLGRVGRLSRPCARCGTKPEDSGISDCDDSGGGGVATDTTDLNKPSTDSSNNVSRDDAACERSTTVGDGSGGDGGEAATTVVERGIMKNSNNGGNGGGAVAGDANRHGRTTRRAKTVTFRLQDSGGDKYSSPSLTRSHSAPQMKPVACGGSGSGDCVSMSESPRRKLEGARRPRLILSSVETASLDAATEHNSQQVTTACGQRIENTEIPNDQDCSGKLSVILEQRDDETTAHEIPAPQRHRRRWRMSEQDTDSSNVPTVVNIPRCRSNINELIVGRNEDSDNDRRISDNFEEFRLEDDMEMRSDDDRQYDCDNAEVKDARGCVFSAGSNSDRSTDSESLQLNKHHDTLVTQLHASRPTEHVQVEKVVDGDAYNLLASCPHIAVAVNYDKFLEQSGLSQKSINSPMVRAVSASVTSLVAPPVAATVTTLTGSNTSAFHVTRPRHVKQLSARARPAMPGHLDTEAACVRYISEPL